MTDDAPQPTLPRSLDEIDAAFMTTVLLQSGVILHGNEVVGLEECEAGPAKGYFSDIKRVRCAFKAPVESPGRFVVKTWPSFEALPHGAIRAMFMREVKAYQCLSSGFFPRPKIHLAAFNAEQGRWMLVMDDVSSFAVHKSHEIELTLDEVMRMIPKMVDVAVAWEGCDKGEKSRRLDEVGIEPWVSQVNLGTYKALMPSGAKVFDKFTSIGGTSVAGTPTWPESVGGPGIVEMFARRVDAFFDSTRPANGATCTLAHGDLRGDNIFFCKPSNDYPDGWLCIDFQQMFRGPVPSDLAYLMSSGTVLPEIYVGEPLQNVMRSFYELFMMKTRVYKTYSYDHFVSEYATMSAVPISYYLATGALFWIGGAFHNQLATRVELGGKGATEADLSPEELRQRMWWRKALANSRENLKTFNHYAHLRGLPENPQETGHWLELPNHLRAI